MEYGKINKYEGVDNMDFGEKLKDIRKREGFSQEQLAEKIGVSRQAITKWETGKGLPDLENMKILAEIFKTTLDELISKEELIIKDSVEKYKSETIYDIDCNKDFDINLGSAKTIIVSSGKDEKLHIELMSDTLENLTQLFKVKLDENRNKLDVDCIKKNNISEVEIGEVLTVKIILPEGYTRHCELEATSKEVILEDLSLECFEYDGEAKNIIINNCSKSLEFTSKSDYNITVDRINGRLDINQLKASTIIHIPETEDFSVLNKGRKCNVFWKKNGESCDSIENPQSENLLCISGIKSEMIIDLI